MSQWMKTKTQDCLPGLSPRFCPMACGCNMSPACRRRLRTLGQALFERFHHVDHGREFPFGDHRSLFALQLCVQQRLHLGLILVVVTFGFEVPDRFPTSSVASLSS